MKRVLGLASAVLVLTFLAACEETKLRIDRVEPAEGITAGGDHVNIVGVGLQPGKTQVRVAFGSHVAEQVVIGSKDKINVVTPNGDKGPVDVTLDFDDGQRFKIPGGFRYVEPKQNDDLRKAFFNKPKTAEKK
jgi:IPT/TIG domain